jgi:hypothetical protein
MTQAKELLDLVEEFPAAFADPEAAVAQTAIANLPTSGKTQQLLALITEFPEAFVDPESTPPNELAASVETEVPSVAETDTTSASVSALPAATLPSGYAQALHRRIPSFTWGTIDCYLTYGEQGLERFWVTVGKSGTEVQSLCEAIARLVNLLLVAKVSIPEIVRELRGIRGGDSEGLGPNRVLGLVDLLGKVLQEAATVGESLTMHSDISSISYSAPVPQTLSVPPQPVTAPVSLASSSEHKHDHTSEWTSLSHQSHSASLCPECGSELHQINGCSGGSCQVCGYSSCS